MLHIFSFRYDCEWISPMEPLEPAPFFAHPLHPQTSLHSQPINYISSPNMWTFSGVMV